jgi:ribose transport system substrate-binding protein
MAANPGITVIDPKRYAGATRATAQEAAENLLTAYGDINGVFCPNESSTFGMLLALRGRGMSPYVKFVGFDASEGLVEALTVGDIHALVVQNPMKMGYLGVTTAVNYIRGQAVDIGIDTGVALVTKENMSQPEFKEVLSPDLSQYLDAQ